MANKSAKVPKMYPVQQNPICERQAGQEGRAAQRERERSARGPMGVDDEEDMYFINC